jgi:hypothetical protein
MQRAEVLLLDLRQPTEFTDDLFAHCQPAVAGDSWHDTRINVVLTQTIAST